MSEVFKIECPECGEKFDAGSAFNAHIESTKKQQAEIIKKEVKVNPEEIKEALEVLTGDLHYIQEGLT